ncbi:hypothetical protein D3C81_1698560 [compost metagenome]
MLFKISPARFAFPGRGKLINDQFLLVQQENQRLPPVQLPLKYILRAHFHAMHFQSLPGKVIRDFLRSKLPGPGVRSFIIPPTATKQQAKAQKQQQQYPRHIHPPVCFLFSK